MWEDERERWAETQSKTISSTQEEGKEKPRKEGNGAGTHSTELTEGHNALGLQRKETVHKWL